MNCESTQRMLYEAVDRALTPDERRLLDAHLAGCERCRSEAAVLDALIKTVEATPAAKPSEAFLSNVMAQLPATSRSSSWSSWFAPSLVFPRLVFAITLAAAALVWLYRASLAEIVENFLPVQTVAGPVTTAIRDVQAYLQAQAGAALTHLPVPVSTSVEWGSLLLVATTLAVGYLLIRAAENLHVGRSSFRIGRRY
ncbi:MAG: zf-HC2 domain-containing protein [Gemmatimonadetes bacterium]|nr:zf-HC2 domain-containing protein [Gemmatimonadota bacterium]